MPRQRTIELTTAVLSLIAICVNGGKDASWSETDIRNLNINWDRGSSAKLYASFYACNTGPKFAQMFANAQNVTAYGYDAYSYFSTTPDKIVEPPAGYKGPVYNIAGDYGENGLGGAIRYRIGKGQIYPMKLYTPQNQQPRQTQQPR